MNRDGSSHNQGQYFQLDVSGAGTIFLRVLLIHVWLHAYELYIAREKSKFLNETLRYANLDDTSHIIEKRAHVPVLKGNLPLMKNRFIRL